MAWTSTGEESASNEVVHADVPLCAPESQASVWVEQSEMSLHVSPPLLEYWKSTFRSVRSDCRVRVL